MSKNKKLIPELRFPEFKKDRLWEKKYFEELFNIGNGRDYKHLDKGDIPVYGSGGYMLSVNDYLFDGESVCIGRKGTIDRPIFLTGKFWTVDTLFYTYSFKDCIPKYIYYVFQNINWLKHNEAGGVPSLSKTNIYKIETLIPQPNEQQKIASCLSSLDEVIAAHSQKLELLKEHKKGLMQNLFPQEGEKVPKYRFPEFGKDGYWVKKTLGEMTIKVGSGVTPLGGEVNYKKTGRPFVRSQNISWGVFLLNDIAFIDEATHQNSINTEIELEDVLLNITGASIGRSAVANELVSGGNVNQHVCIIRTIRDILNPFFVNQFLMSDLGQKQIDSFQAGGNRQGLNFAQIRSFIIPIPPKQKEQKKIACCIIALDELISAQTEKIEQLKLHKKGLMQGLFPKITE
jgi:type I restriction enzyme S subunit